MNNFKAVETVYKVYRFRSRLEARWAIFFDSLGITMIFMKCIVSYYGQHPKHHSPL